MTKEQLSATAKFILDCEARRDSKGRLKVYPLPGGDGGGTFEVAGINDKYDHDIAHELRSMLTEGHFEEAEIVAQNYYIENTDGVLKWGLNLPPAVEASLRDTVFNRGIKGAARTLQLALEVRDDGVIGPVTKAIFKNAVLKSVEDLLKNLREASERYERAIAPPVGKRAKFWIGLNNRWDKRLEFSLTLLP